MFESTREGRAASSCSEKQAVRCRENSISKLHHLHSKTPPAIPTLQSQGRKIGTSGVAPFGHLPGDSGHRSWKSWFLSEHNERAEEECQRGCLYPCRRDHLSHTPLTPTLPPCSALLASRSSRSQSALTPPVCDGRGLCTITQKPQRRLGGWRPALPRHWDAAAVCRACEALAAHVG